MSRRPHPHDADIGGIAASRRRAVDDLAALDPGSRRKSGCRLWFTAIAAGLIAGIGLSVGFVITVVIL